MEVLDTLKNASPVILSLAAILYVIIGIGVVFLVGKIEDRDVIEDSPLAFVFMWPVFLVIYLISKLVATIIISIAKLF